ncbi:MAG TPA: radical SAM protein [Terriglobales bacterium]|nr:radical SAM protein [Terriglobales bacterium]
MPTRNDSAVSERHSDTRIVLVNPPVLAVFEPWYDTPDFGRTALACLAAYLRLHGYPNIKIVDAKFDRLSFEECLRDILAFEPDLVGYTAFTNEIKPAAYVAARLKRLKPGILNIIGGVHVTAIPLKTMQEFPMFDIGVIGEGEATLLEVVEQYAAKQPVLNIPGTIYHDLDDQLQQGPARERIMDQDSLPIPAWDLMKPANTYFVQTLRGCPFNCLFCMNPSGRIARKRSIGLVMEELRGIVDNYHPERISFGDELFSVDVARTHALLDALIESGLGARVKWDVQTHVRYVDAGMFRKFKLANVDRVEMGIETGDEQSLKKMGKGTNLQMIEDAYQAARREGVKIGTFFILGQPDETTATIMKTIGLAVRINPELPMFGLMTPYPGTAIAEMAAKGEGGYKLLSTDWDEYNKQIGGALALQNISRRKLEFYQSLAYLMVYLRNRRFRDLFRFLLTYRVGIYKFVRKVFSGKQNLMHAVKKPGDYDRLLSTGTSVDQADMIESYRAWSKYQKDSMVSLRHATAAESDI